MRRVLKLTIGVVIAALVIHTWVAMGLIVPVTVTGSSMAPTLLGPHREFHCQECQRDFDVGLDQLPRGDEAFCPQCNERRARSISDSDRPGDRLIVDRTTFACRFPRRWEVVVFRCPGNEVTFCVKRILGLPGETVMLDEGDVFVDGHLVRKTLSEQRALRQLVYEETSSLHDAAEFSFQLPRVGPVTDESSFNQNISPPPNRVPDLMLTFDGRLEGSGRVLVAASHPGGLCEVAVACGKNASVFVRQNGKALAEEGLDQAVLLPDRLARWTFSLFDRQALIAIGDCVVLAVPLAPGGRETMNGTQLTMRTEGLTGEIRYLAVWRDVYYGVRHGDWPMADQGASWRLGPREFFVAGDNAAISDDSRSWPAGAGLDAELLIGTPIGVR